MVSRIEVYEEVKYHKITLTTECHGTQFLNMLVWHPARVLYHWAHYIPLVYLQGYFNNFLTLS